MHPHSATLAIVETSTLAAIGLQQLLEKMLPSVRISTFGTFDELRTADDGRFAHYFVASRIYFEHTAYFRASSRRVIVLVSGDMQIQGVMTLNVCQSEQLLVKSILALHSQGHPGNQHPAVMPTAGNPALLSPREVEVTILLAKGLINKEIADRLHISTNTAITHRKNIMDKLHARSLVDVIIYAVVNGLVDVGEL